MPCAVLMVTLVAGMSMATRISVWSPLDRNPHGVLDPTQDVLATTPLMADRAASDTHLDSDGPADPDAPRPATACACSMTPRSGTALVASTPLTSVVRPTGECSRE